MADMRMNVTEESVVTFKETPAGVPPAVKTLFYGGERNGYELVYPTGGPVMIARIAPQPEITYTPASVAPIPEELVEPEPAPIENAPVTELVTEPVLEPEAALPRTASPLPLVALGGLASLVLGLGAGLLRRHLNW